MIESLLLAVIDDAALGFAFGTAFGFAGAVLAAPVFFGSGFDFGFCGACEVAAGAFVSTA